MFSKQCLAIVFQFEIFWTVFMSYTGNVHLARFDLLCVLRTDCSEEASVDCLDLFSKVGGIFTVSASFLNKVVKATNHSDGLNGA